MRAVARYQSFKVSRRSEFNGKAAMLNIEALKL
jgi:hypothetical protein